MSISPNGLSFEEVRLISMPQRLLGAALGLPSLLLLSYGLWRLDRMLINFQTDAMFALSTIAHLRAFAAAMVASIGLDIAVLPIRGVLFGLLSTGQAGRVAMGISSEQLLLILVCGLFFLITNLMHESRRLAQENEGFI